MTDLRAAVEAWAAHLNAGEYFQAHEVLEEPWLRAQEPERTFLKGLIHAAVALYHYRRGNAHGAGVKHASAARYLAPYRPEYLGVEIGTLLLDLEELFHGLASHRPGAPLPEPDRPWPRVVLRDAGDLPR
jgi:uncharacterized protein